MSRCRCTPGEHAAEVRNQVRQLPAAEQKRIEQEAAARAQAFMLAVKAAEEKRKPWQT